MRQSSPYRPCPSLTCLSFSILATRRCSAASSTRKARPFSAHTSGATWAIKRLHTASQSSTQTSSCCFSTPVYDYVWKCIHARLAEPKGITMHPECRVAGNPRDDPEVLVEFEDVITVLIATDAYTPAWQAGGQP